MRVACKRVEALGWVTLTVLAALVPYNVIVWGVTPSAVLRLLLASAFLVAIFAAWLGTARSYLLFLLPLLCLVLGINVVHASRYDTEVSIAAIAAIIDTDPAEAIAFASGIPLRTWVACLAVFIGPIVLVAIPQPIRRLTRASRLAAVVPFLILLGVMHIKALVWPAQPPGWAARWNLPILHPSNDNGLSGYFHRVPLLRSGMDAIGAFEERRKLADLLRTDTAARTDATSSTRSAVFVVVIGESLRRSQLSLYGYPRDTTPRLSSEARTLRFDNAIAPATNTPSSLPLILGRLVSWCRDAGFETHWVSNQARVGPFDTRISAIAMTAEHTQWMNTTHFSSSKDERLLPPLREIVSRQGERPKVVFVHMIGSHPPAALRYPGPGAFVLTDAAGAVAAIQHYDNSVWYTDRVLGELIDMLRNRRASLVFFADHGLEWDARTKPHFFHGGGEVITRAAFDVPLVFWFSPEFERPVVATDRLAVLYPLEHLQHTLVDWMGIRTTHQIPARSLFHPGYRAADPVEVIDDFGKRIPYARLRPALRSDLNPPIESTAAPGDASSAETTVVATHAGTRLPETGR